MVRLCQFSIVGGVRSSVNTFVFISCGVSIEVEEESGRNCSQWHDIAFVT